MANLKGKSYKALTMDVVEGYISVNPLFLKRFDPEALQEFYHEINNTQKIIRAEKFPANDSEAIRTRNLKLQRLYLATVIIRTFARERRIVMI